MTPKPAVSPVATIKALHDRLIRAEALVAEGKVHPVYGMTDYYIVEGGVLSGTRGTQYLVNDRCVCPDATNRPELKGLCKHKLAATIYAEQQAKGGTPKIASPAPERSIDELVSELY